ncbi:MAG TPA: PQQ-binding-like beta-propeller repeat protein, partial [Planctomycetaceae bacterium]|nr:PQQ-binding-like beta-propeller repeat protein [Planctomycetaceae bacterium]
MSENVSGLPLSSAGPTCLWHSALVNRTRLVLAMAVTAILPYAYGRALVVYSQYRVLEPRFLIQLAVATLAVMALTFGLAPRFSRRTAWISFGVVFAIWMAFYTFLVFAYNGEQLPAWLVFAGFVPATLWVLWLAWIFFLPIPWFLRGTVLGILVVATIPYLTLFEINGLTGDTHVNFALRSQKKTAIFDAQAGEIEGKGVKLVENRLTDFPAFQGPDRTAVLHNVKLARDWNEHPPRELWRVAAGSGWSSFAVVGGYAFTLEQRGNQECVVARDLKTGHEVWVHKDEANLPRNQLMGGPGPRSTPTVFEGRVYSIGATGIFNCLDGGTGRVIWSKNILADVGGDLPGHGVSGSPLIVDELVIVDPTGRADASLAAYKRDNGERVWAKGHDAAAYASPMLASFGSSTQILNNTTRGLTAHDPRSGAILWHYDWSNEDGVICSQPITNAGAPDQVLLTAGYSAGSQLLKVTRDDKGVWSASPVWERPSRHMKTKFTTAVLRDDFVYGLDDGIMQCIDVKTGQQKWKGGRYGHGQILLVDDLIVVQTEPGPVVLIEASPKKLVELGKVNALSSKTWNCPALAGKYLLVRNDTEAVCY